MSSTAVAVYQPLEPTVERTCPGNGKIDIPKLMKLFFMRGLTKSECARELGVSVQAVDQRLDKLAHLMRPQEEIIAWDENRTDFYKSMELTLASEMLDPVKLKTASVNNLAYALRQTHDMRQLKEGLSTGNINHNVLVGDATKLSNEVQRMLDELARLEAGSE